MTSPRHVVMDLSDRRRVLAASDVHGEFDRLAAALDELAFDGTKDALMLIGDLVDRGPDSPAFEDWIGRDGVFRTLGNHDVVPRAYLDDRIDARMVEDFGGKWFLDLPQEERRRVASVLEDAPIAVTCRTPIGRNVGFVHADCTKNWDDTLALLDHEMRSRRDWAFDFTLESRETIREVRRMASEAAGRTIDTARAMVSGIDHVFHGHTTVPSPFSHGNRSWIDTSACTGGPMTVIDVDRWLDDLDRHSPFSH